jgi:hypothetical protein
MRQRAYNLLEEDGLGTYFLLTRGVRPVLEKELNWDCEFNRLAPTPEMKRLFAHLILNSRDLSFGFLASEKQLSRFALQITFKTGLQCPFSFESCKQADCFCVGRRLRHMISS